MRRAGELCEAEARVELTVSDIKVLTSRGAVEDVLSAGCCAFVFRGPSASPSELYLVANGSEAQGEPEDYQLMLAVNREALARLGGDLMLLSPGAFHLSTAVRLMVMAILEPRVLASAVSAYQFAKGIEVVCEVLRQHRDGELLPLADDGALSAADTRRILAARRLIEERCSEKLTLDAIARSCGLNRSKLTRGFRDLFKCTVAEALSERRLELASSMLLTTDLPVASVGYEAGYENKASFARAFGRRFGRTPSDYRTGAIAA